MLGRVSHYSANRYDCMRLYIHANLLKTGKKQRAIQRLCKHIALVLARFAIGDSTIELWLRIYLSSEEVFFYLRKETLTHGTNASPLDTGQVPHVRGITVSHGGYALGVVLHGVEGKVDA